MQRSHSRHSYPFDKRVPKMEPLKKVHNVYINSRGETEVYTYYDGYCSLARQAEKEMHKNKQRQYNKQLCREF